MSIIVAIAQALRTWVKPLRSAAFLKGSKKLGNAMLIFSFSGMFSTPGAGSLSNCSLEKEEATYLNVLLGHKANYALMCGSNSVR